MNTGAAMKKQFLDLKNKPKIADFLDDSAGEESTLWIEIDALREALPVIISSADGGNEKLLKAGMIVSHTLVRLTEIWGELRG